jgi:hypothetical protein
MDVEASPARSAPTKRRRRGGDVSISVVTEIGSLKRRLAAAREAEGAASALLAKRLTNVKRLAGAGAGKVATASIEARLPPNGTGRSLKETVGSSPSAAAVPASWYRGVDLRRDLAERFLDIDLAWIARRHAKLGDDFAAAAAAMPDRRREILARLGVDFSPFVSVQWLRGQFPDYDFGAGAALITFLEERAAEAQPVSLHWLFDEHFYRAVYPAPEAKLGLAPQPSYFEFLLSGMEKGRRPHRLFNPDWYRTRFSVGQDVPAFEHFLREGIFEDWSPTPLFDPEFYRKTYP